MPQFIGGGVNHVGLRPVPRSGAVLHFLQDDRPIADDAVGVGFDPQVGGTNGEKLGRCNGSGRSCKTGLERVSKG